LRASRFESVVECRADGPQLDSWASSEVAEKIPEEVS
jgi:hypothetical protein